MGIKGINKLLTEKSKDAFFPLPIEKLSGKRIAIDGNNWMYTNMAIARKKIINKTDVTVEEPDPFEIRKEWFIALMNFIIGWLYYNIVPVFVIDGKHPVEKDGTKAKRREIRNEAKSRIDTLYQQLDNNILERPVNLIEDLRKELENYNYIGSEDFDLFKKVLKSIGIPFLQAVADGEQLCSMLCVEGLVAGVFSVDTDNLVYGCPLIINRFSKNPTYDEFGQRVATLDCVRLDYVLKGLEISHDTFVDLCIMCGCDFNTNIVKIGPKRSYDLLQQHGSIDNLPRNMDSKCLLHNRCREIFKYVTSKDLTFDELMLDINKNALATSREYLELAGIVHYMDKLVKMYSSISDIKNGYVEELQLATPPKYIPPEPVQQVNVISRAPILFNIISCPSPIVSSHYSDKSRKRTPPST